MSAFSINWAGVRKGLCENLKERVLDFMKGQVIRAKAFNSKTLWQVKHSFGLPPLIAEVTNNLSSQTTGLECAKPGLRTFHLIAVPFSPSQASGKFWLSAIPAACCSRKEGQLSLVDCF